MRRMAEVTEGHQLRETPPELGDQAVPPGVLLYVIEGPMFFGAAEKASEAISITENIRGVILIMESVPTMDITGLVALESTLRRLTSRGITAVLTGLRPQPKELIEKADLTRSEIAHIAPTLEEAYELFH